MSSVYQLFELYTALQLFEPQTQYGKAHMQTPAQIQGWLLDRGVGLEKAAVYYEEVLITFTLRQKRLVLSGCLLNDTTHCFHFHRKHPVSLDQTFTLREFVLTVTCGFFFSPVLRQSKCLFYFRVSDG